MTRRIEPALHWLLTIALLLLAFAASGERNKHNHLESHHGTQKRIAMIERRLERIERLLASK